jgi:3-deoxy-D-manno-octulosonic acid kinase
MKSTTLRLEKSTVLCRTKYADVITDAWFDPGYWQNRGRCEAAARGRGAAWFVADDHNEFVLRHYQRGGKIAALLDDRYFWQGLEHSRAWREWRLLADMVDEGLPVPQPVAARVVRCGLFYRADLVTQKISNVVPLSEALWQGALPHSLWCALGQCLARFHYAGVYHADLNAHNILLQDESIFLIDFDKGSRRSAGAWQQQNLDRLKRSLDKLNSTESTFHFSAGDWAALLGSYEAGMASGG